MFIGQYETHPLADTLPLAAENRLESMADSIATNGLRLDIVLHEGKILDGRTRLAACIHAKVEPRFRVFGSLASDGDDPIQFVWDMNGERRDLSDAQRALAVRALEKLRRKLSKALGQRNQRKLPIDRDVEQLLASVRETGTDELQQAVAAGDVDASTAAELAQLPADEQRRYLQPKEQPPERAIQGADTFTSVARKLQPDEIGALRAVVRLLAPREGELGLGGRVIKELVPWL